MLAKRGSWLLLGLPVWMATACGGDNAADGQGLAGSSAHAGKGAGANGSGGTTAADGGTGAQPVVPITGGSAGSAGSAASGGSSGSASPTGGSAGAEMCASSKYEQDTASALDIYFVFDRTGSMGKDCAYAPNATAPEDSKACFATYAVSNYLINVASSVDTRLALQFMSQEDDCDGGPYETPLIPLTQLPVPSDHALIKAISDETFQGGLGTHIEGALRGIAAYTKANRVDGREMIGVLMTDGDPQGCDEDMTTLANIMDQHLQDTGIRTFIIGMEGATEDNLERLGRAGGAEGRDDEWCGDVDAPCHYWNVGTGSDEAISAALTAIVGQAAPIPCEFPVSGLKPPAGQSLDFGKVNVTLTDNGTESTIGQVANKDACPDDVAAWYYDNAAAPTAIELCANACSAVTEADAVNVVVGCQGTVVLPPVR